MATLDFVFGKSDEEVALARRAEEEARYAEVLKLNEDRERKLAQLLSKRKKVKLATYLLVFSLMFGLLASNVWLVFFSDKLTMQDVGNVVNSSYAVFPTGGLQGYLAANISKWHKDKIVLEENQAAVVNSESLMVHSVEPQTSELAKVVFSVKINDIRTTFFVFVKNLKYYDQGAYAGNGYALASELTVSAFKLLHSAEKAEEPLLYFNAEDEVDKATLESATTKIDKLLDDFYSNKDISQEVFVAGNLDRTGEYKGLVSFIMFSQPNAFGYNAYVEYWLSVNGVKTKVAHYLAVFPNGSSWSINGVQ